MRPLEKKFASKIVKKKDKKFLENTSKLRHPRDAPKIFRKIFRNFEKKNSKKKKIKS